MASLKPGAAIRLHLPELERRGLESSSESEAAPAAEQAVEVVLGLNVYRVPDSWLKLTPRTLEDYG